MFCFFFSSRRRHTSWTGDWSSDVCSSDLAAQGDPVDRQRVPMSYSEGIARVLPGEQRDRKAEAEADEDPAEALPATVSDRSRAKRGSRQHDARCAETGKGVEGG